MTATNCERCRSASAPASLPICTAAESSARFSNIAAERVDLCGASLANIPRKLCLSWRATALPWGMRADLTAGVYGMRGVPARPQPARGRPLLRAWPDRATREQRDEMALPGEAPALLWLVPLESVGNYYRYQVPI
jgi:hypothetical protein